MSGPVKNSERVRAGAAVALVCGVLALMLVCAAAGFGLALVPPSVARWVIGAAVVAVVAVGVAIRRDLTR